MAARVQARSGIGDFVEGSDVGHLLYAVGEEVESVEVRLARIRDSFTFEGLEGPDLDERVAELPPGFTPRLPSSAAAGRVLTVTRGDASTIQVLPKGAMVGRTDNPRAMYRTSQAVTFGVGVSVVGQVHVTSTTHGPEGNAAAGAINRTVSCPSWVLSVLSSAPLTNGLPAESDAELASRALLYLSSLARCQPAALEYAARSFQASDKTRFRYVKLYEDPVNPGYSELIIDDGSQLSGAVRAGRPASGTIPAGGVGLLWHEGPATAPIDTVFVDRGGMTYRLRNRSGSRVNFVSVPERGAIYIVRPAAFQVGDRWRIQGYDVFSGGPAELQQIIEGVPGDPSFPGFRAAGTRVRIVRPSVQDVALDIHVVPVAGVDLESLEASVQNDAIQYIATLNPGEPLLIARLTAYLIGNASVRNVHVYRGATEPPELATDIYPTTSRHVLRSRVGLLNIIPAPEL